MAQKDDRRPNNLINDNFSVIISDGKCSQHRCIHCERQSVKNVSRILQHLNQCVIYKNALTAKFEDSNSSKQLSITNMIRFFNQTQIIPAHRAAAMSVYMTNFSFNHFESPYVITHHQALNSGYKPFHSELVTDRLLNEVYEEIKSKVNGILNVSQHLSFFIDETINIRKKQTINLCCHVLPSITLKGNDFQLKVVVNVAENMIAIVQIE